MGCYYTLWFNTYAFSLLFYKVYTKRENADNWNSGQERSKFEIPILHNSKSPKNLQRIILEYIKILAAEIPGGDPPASHKLRGRALSPWVCPVSLWALEQVSGAHLLL
jgi:hypothetical protein